MSLPDLPKVKWLNSRTKFTVGCKGPHVVHDGMPDGVFDEPCAEVLAEMIRSQEQAAQRDWFYQVYGNNQWLSGGRP